MMNRLKRSIHIRQTTITLTLISFFALTSPSFAKVKYIPVVSGQFTTGQWYFEGERSSLGGNAQLTFVPALRFSDSFSLIPTLETNYRGTRTAEELAGGNTLFQDTWENTISVKGVHSLGRKWKIRERVGYQFKFFRETTNETLGNGLYDYQIFNLGGEVEHRFNKKTSLALGYDLSFLVFPNYTSLESNQSGDLAREFAGTDVLDTTIQLVSLRGKMPLFWKIQSAVQGFYSPRYYPDQHIVDLSGLLTASKRRDTFTGGTIAIERFFKTPKRTNLLASVSYGYTGLDSNQNHYDARLTTFVGDYFDYDQQKIGSQLSFAFGKKRYGAMVLDVGAAYTRRNYRSRVTQSVNGTYLTEKLNVRESALAFGFSYPLSKNFRLNTNATFGRSKSNTQYEEVYRYNYNNANYQFGFTYEY